MFMYRDTHEVKHEFLPSMLKADFSKDEFDKLVVKQKAEGDIEFKKFLDKIDFELEAIFFNLRKEYPGIDLHDGGLKLEREVNNQERNSSTERLFELMKDIKTKKRTLNVGNLLLNWIDFIDKANARYIVCSKCSASVKVVEFKDGLPVCMKCR